MRDDYVPKITYDQIYKFVMLEIRKNDEKDKGLFVI